MASNEKTVQNEVTELRELTHCRGPSPSAVVPIFKDCVCANQYLLKKHTREPSEVVLA